MTARCVPEQPTFRSRAEKRVWTELRRKLPDGSLLMANLCFTGYDGDWEVWALRRRAARRELGAGGW